MALTKNFSCCHVFSGDGIVVRGQAYGIRSIRVDGNDALAVYSAVREAREMAIKDQMPVLIEVGLILSYQNLTLFSSTLRIVMH